MKVNYHLVDVFTDRQFGGNQLAVVPDGQGIPGEAMQTIAREFNLSETTFVLPAEDPANTCKVRIFTPGRELPMAGHPTVGTAFVLARSGIINPESGQTRAMARFEEGVGPIRVSVDFEGGQPGTIWMTQLLPGWGETFDDRAAVAEVLSLNTEDIDSNLPIQVVSCGVPFTFVPLRSLDAARRAHINLDAWQRTISSRGLSEIFLFTREVENPGSTVHSRMFAPGMGIAEDPATGAASGPLGCYLVRYGLVPVPDGGTAHIVSEQGIEMLRPSFVHIEIDSQGGEISGVHVGGTCMYMGSGTLELDI